jgi:hypothetical protein
MNPSAIPDSWNARGRESTAVPIIVFQQLKIITIEELLF